MPAARRPVVLERLTGVAARLEAGAVPPADHRLWPLPAAPWIIAQTWEDLLFAHWPVPPAALASLLPAGLRPDTFEGAAWLTLSPFRLTGFRLRGLPALPGLSDFPEVNVRTYSTLEGKPGVVFFSLDAGSRAAVAGARWLYHLPYFRARFAIATAGERIRYASRRVGGRAAELVVEYGPSGPVRPAARDSLAWWLTERYCLYAVDTGGRVHRAEIHHEPWPLQPAEATITRNTLTEIVGAPVAGPPLLQFARRLDVRVWLPHEAAGEAPRRAGAP
jgi:uncharacterized protein